MILSCGSCGRRHPLTEEDAVLFHPRFFCLSCGARIPFSLTETEIDQLRAKTDPDRRLPDAAPVPERQTVRHVRSENRDGQGTDGG